MGRTRFISAGFDRCLRGGGRIRRDTRFGDPQARRRWPDWGCNAW